MILTGYRSMLLSALMAAGGASAGAEAVVTRSSGEEVLVSLPRDYEGRLDIRAMSESGEYLRPMLYCDDGSAVGVRVEKITDREVRFLPAEALESVPGAEWRLEVPAGFLTYSPLTVEVAEMPYTEEELRALVIPGAWHKAGGEWTGLPMRTIHDDDGVDGKIPSCGATHLPDRNGYFTILYPLLTSLGLRGCVSAEGWRCGMTGTPPAPNDNARVMLRLQNEAGWEIQAHSMEVLGQTLNNWVVDSLGSPEALKVLAESGYAGDPQKCASVYDLRTGRQYFPSADHEGWIEAESREIKPYAADPATNRVVLYNPAHDVDYHWGEWFRLAGEFGFRSKAWVQHNAITSHAYARAINSYSPYGFSDMVPPYQYNLPPLRSTATRIMMEGQSAPGYKGEASDDNSWDAEQYEWYVDWIDRCVAERGWLVMGLHAYRRCWRNALPGALVSEGGDYPDEWVDPLAGMDFLEDPLTPPANLGISSWSEWHPCPGTRLDMLRALLAYALEKGMLNVGSTEGFELMGNRVAEGYYNGGVRIGMDRWHLLDDLETYPHFIVAPTGEASYFNPEENEAMSIPLFAGAEPGTSGTALRVRLDTPEYYDMTGMRIADPWSHTGIMIRVGHDGKREKLIRMRVD